MNPFLKRLALIVLKPWSDQGIDTSKFAMWCVGIPRSWHRPFDNLELRGIGAEIGVYQGMHAKHLLKRHQAIEQLWLVDPYIPYPKEDGLVPNLLDAEEMAHRVTRKYQEKVKWLRMESPKCTEFLPNLDFCYIDANHGYQSVKLDISALWPKIRPGGVIGGHDFHRAWPGVIRAVTEFSVYHEMILNVETPDWWIFRSQHT